MANLALHPKSVALFEETNKLFDKVKMELSAQEENFVRQLLVTKAIPPPRLLIQNHMTINEKEEYQKILVIPATNCTATFSKIGYLGIKRLLDKGKVNYSNVSIVQAYYLKERLDELKVRRDKVKIFSVDAINMYLSIKLSIIKKAVRLFTRKLTTVTKKTINLCVELIPKRMSSMHIYSGGEYYEYHGGENEKKGLAIGGHESAFLVDLVAS